MLSAGSPTYPLDSDPYYAFGRLEGNYGEHTFIHSWFGSIFTYQYSHAFVDFRGLEDEKGTDWYQKFRGGHFGGKAVLYRPAGAMGNLWRECLGAYRLRHPGRL